MDLEALSDFGLVAAHGGFAKASRATGRPKATLSRKVTELERSLGVRLIDRGTRALRLTEEGRALSERIQGPLSEISEARAAVGAGASTPRGTIRVSAPMVLSHVALARVAADFVRAHPEVEVDLVAEDRTVDPVEDNYDVVIRVDPKPEDRLVGRRIFLDERVLIGSPGMALPPEGEEAVAAVGLARTASEPWHVMTESGPRRFTPNMRLRLSTYLLVRDAVMAGAGFALVPKLIIAEALAAGRLTRHGVEDGRTVEIWALQHSRRLASLKVRLFLDALERAFRP